jgi:DNA-binding CsgD family transcriptional regulator
MDDDRYATQRGRYLAKTTTLRKPEAEAVAYAELGYSRYGISTQMGKNEGTVKDYLHRVQALYGLDAISTLAPGEFDDPPELERVEPGYHTTLRDRDEQIMWIELVRKYDEKLPQEWVAEVVGSAREDGVPVSDPA